MAKKSKSSPQQREYERLIETWDRFGPLAALQVAKRCTARGHSQRIAALIVRGMCLTSLLRYEEAARDLRTALREAGPKGERHISVRMGELYEAKGSLVVAEKWFRRAAAGRPRHTMYLMPLGALLARQSRLGEATRVFRRATLVEDGEVEAAHYNLGRVYMSRGRPREALYHLDRALETDPRYKDAKRARRDVLRSVELRKKR